MPLLIATLALLLAGWLIAAPLAVAIGLPLPYLLGPLLMSGALGIWRPGLLPEGYVFPQWLRQVFIGFIGLMIGGQVTPALFSEPARLTFSIAALAGFVIMAQGMNYVLFRRLGGYDRTTALCAGAPGGLYESIALGEEHGADLPRLMLQQFMRIILVVTALPIGLSLWLGAPVGSSAGMSFARADTDWSALPLILITLAAGIAAGHVLRLPARQLTGPLAAAGVVTLSGLAVFDLPQWLIDDAQIVVGVSLGLRFKGLDRRLLLRGVWLSALSVTGMMALAALFAGLLRFAWPEPFDVLLISFAPGGLTEMALVALSLQANPAFVTLHHIIRILLTVIGLSALSRRLGRTL